MNRLFLSSGKNLVMMRGLVGINHRITRNNWSMLSQKQRFLSTIPFSFKEAKSGDVIEVQGVIGKSIMETAIENNVDIEGACGGELACSTCHVILSKELFQKLPKRVEEEEDMLDLAWGTTET